MVIASIPQDQVDLDTLVELARRFEGRHRFAEAADLFTTALRLDPKNSGLQLALAEVSRRRRQYQETAPKSVRQAMEERHRRDSIDAGHFLGLAHLFDLRGESSRAEEYLEVAQARANANASVFRLRGQIRYRRGEFDEAAEALAQALRFNPFDREVAETLGRVQYERRSFTESLEATVHAFHLLAPGDSEGEERLRRRTRTLRQILRLEKEDLAALVRRVRDRLEASFDRLQWHRERFLERAGLPDLEREVEALPRRRSDGLLDLAVRIRRLGCWNDLTDEQIVQVAGTVREELFETGADVLTHGTTGEDIYLLERGRAEVLRRTPHGTFSLAHLGAGAVLGEANFIRRFQRCGDAVAREPTVTLRFDAAALRKLFEQAPDLGVQLHWSFWRSLAAKLRATNDQLRSFFAEEDGSESFLQMRHRQEAPAPAAKVASDDKVRLFREQGLTKGELQTLADFSRENTFARGAYLFHEGEPGPEMYVVLEGRVLISKHIPGAGDEALAILDRGDFFGEMALIDGEPRSADARAHGSAVTVLCLDQETVQEILHMDPEASLELLQLLCRLIALRLHEIDEKVIGWRILAGPQEAVEGFDRPEPSRLGRGGD